MYLIAIPVGFERSYATELLQFDGFRSYNVPFFLVSNSHSYKLASASVFYKMKTIIGLVLVFKVRAAFQKQRSFKTSFWNGTVAAITD